MSRPQSIRKPPAFEAVIFDQDGTIVDSMGVIYEAFIETVLRFGGRHVSRSELFAAMGPPEEKMLKRLLPESSFPEAFEFFFSHYRRAEDRIRFFPGMEQALDLLHGAGVKLGLFTGKGRRGTRDTFGLLNLGRWFPSPVTGDDVRKYKPDPEGVLKALAGMGIPAHRSDRALVVGDSPYDVLAGRAAGTRTGIALWGVTDPSRFAGVEADFRFRQPPDLTNAVLGLEQVSTQREN
ncbi:MAG: HAD family hydrolase [Nitrospinota bacterium]